MKCSKCGAEVVKGAPSCPRCGVKFRWVSSSQSNNPSNHANRNSSAPQQNYNYQQNNYRPDNNASNNNYNYNYNQNDNYRQNNYQAPDYSYYEANRSINPSTPDTPIMVMGILSLSFLLLTMVGASIASICLGGAALSRSKKFELANGFLTGKAKAGKITGIIGLILGIICTVGAALYLIYAVIFTTYFSLLF